MNILTLSIKQKYFDEILAGKKTHEYREIRPTNAKKYITYLCGGKEYPADAELPEEGEVELKPIKYDAIKTSDRCIYGQASLYHCRGKERRSSNSHR